MCVLQPSKSRQVPPSLTDPLPSPSPTTTTTTTIQKFSFSKMFGKDKKKTKKDKAQKQYGEADDAAASFLDELVRVCGVRAGGPEVYGYMSKQPHLASQAGEELAFIFFLSSMLACLCV